jgi:hypothetical protein
MENLNIRPKSSITTSSNKNSRVFAVASAKTNNGDIADTPDINEQIMETKQPETKPSNRIIRSVKNGFSTIMKPFYKTNALISKYYIKSLIFIVILFLVINIFWFYNMDAESSDLQFQRTVVGEPGNKQFKCNYATDGFYYTFTTLSTIGYGDIIPLTPAAKQWATLMQIVVIYLTLKLCDYAYSDGKENSTNTFIQMIKTLQKEISEQTKKEIELARAEIRLGKFYTHEQVKKKLGL